MPEVLFYHLSQSPLELTLPGLLEKSRARGWAALVRAQSHARLVWLDQKLWALDDASFMAHGVAGGQHDVLQPILLTLGGDNPNHAEILFAVDGASVDLSEIKTFTRVCIIFDGSDDRALAHARGQWTQITKAGFAATYWAQQDGRWQRKAAKNQ